MVEDLKANYKKELRKANFHVEELKETLQTADKDDIHIAFDRIFEIYKGLDEASNRVKDAMLDEEVSLEEIRLWSQSNKTDLLHIRNFKSELKDRISDMERKESHQLEKETYQKKLEFELELMRKKNEEKSTKPQSVKLQKYTITPFTGDCRDWIRFWNQFKVEVDGSSIPEISKFNYLLELVQGQPKEHILGLPHSAEGYEEAKKVLEMTYGKDNQVHKALIRDLEALPTITNIHKIKEIHEFYIRLSRTVRTLSTMKKLDRSQAYTYSIMDKLGPVREIIVQSDDDWEGWGLDDIVENLRKYTDRNPLPTFKTGEQMQQQQQMEVKRKEKAMLASPPTQQSFTVGACVYCDSPGHRSLNCTKVLDIASRREILKRKKACYNCAKPGHAASQCKSRGCTKCNSKHHTSLCDKTNTTFSSTSTFKEPTPPRERFYSVLDMQTTLHATIIAQVNGIPARIMLDSGAGSSYISSNLLNELKSKPVCIERRLIEQMYGTVDKQVEIHSVQIESLYSSAFSMTLQCINAEKPTLTYLPNPNISELKNKYPHLMPLKFSDENADQDSLPVHVILGAADLQRIKTTTAPVLGPNPDTDPGAELTRLGWIAAGKSVTSCVEADKNFFLKSSSDEFKQMCSQEVFGLTDDIDQDLCHEKFQEQICRQDDGTYSTRLPWKPDHLPLAENREIALARLRSTAKKLDNLEKLEEYHAIMQEQVHKGILEQVPDTPTGNTIHYVPHQPVFRDDAESTKLRIVYDCSSKSKPQEPSLNDCLEVGPALQPKIFDILLRNRTKTLWIAGDIQKAFLQIRVHPEDRDALRLLWYDDLVNRNIVEYRFTRVIFGSGPSPYILGATLNKHVSQYKEEYPETVKELLNNTYVDDIQSGGDKKEQLLKFKNESTEIMKEGGFILHKWHSNCLEVEESSAPNQEHSTETKILGVPWNKQDDTITVSFQPSSHQSEEHCVTKRQILSSINQIYDLLGLAAPVVIIAKIIYSKVCSTKLKWDDAVPEDVRKMWKRWLQSLKDHPVIKVPRSVVSAALVKMTLHGFADASKLAVGVAIYVLAYHNDTSICQNLLVAKSRIAPKDQTIPRLELIAAHTLSRLMNHVKITLHDLPISEFHGWVDSTTVLYWIEGKGTWSRFIRNRTNSIKENEYMQWHYVPTEENPSDIGSRGSVPGKLTHFWFKGPAWLKDPNKWPRQPQACETDEAAKEVVHVEKQLLVKEERKEEDTFERLPHHYSSYWKLLRVTALILRFINNCRGNKQVGVLTTEEIQGAEKFWIRRAQSNDKPIKSPIELQKDADGIWRCVGRVPNYNPIFLPRNHDLTALIVKQNHEKILHGGVSTTMHLVREKLWVPKLRSLVKKIVHDCNVCKRYRAKPLADARMPKSLLPEFRSELTVPFTVTGVDFAGPVYYKDKKKTTKKAYVALFTCASSRAVHLKLCQNLTATEFQRALKEFVARRGCPALLISDNGKTFVATGKWLNTLKKDQSLANYLAALDVKWRFNLSRAPWWGGFFERLIGIVKRTLSKVVGRSLLTFQELNEVLIDVENTMNNRPLTYLGEEFEQPVITPNTLLRGRPTPVLEEDLERLNDDDMCKRVRLLLKAKADVRKRFVKEYVHALEERHPILGEEVKKVPKTGSVVLLKGDNKHKAQWKLGRVVSQVIGKDKKVRGLKIKLGNGYLIERPLQLVCTLEVGGEDSSWNPTRKEEVMQRVQPSRKTKDAANQKFKMIAQEEDVEE